MSAAVTGTGIANGTANGTGAAERRVLVAGASNQIGYFLLPRLIETGWQPVALARRPAPSWSPSGAHWLSLDLDADVASVPAARFLIHAAPLSLLPRLLNETPAPPARVVAFSSTSRFAKTDSPDATERSTAEILARGEDAARAACARSGAALTVFRPTLVYGCGLDGNVAFLARFARRWGWLPLPGRGSGLRQPVHADDLAAACVRVLELTPTHGRAYALSGGETLTYAAMLRKILTAVDRRPRLLRIPAPAVKVALAGARLLPGYGHLTSAMVDRVDRDLVFDHDEATRDFGFQPRGFEPDPAHWLCPPR